MSMGGSSSGAYGHGDGVDCFIFENYQALETVPECTETETVSEIPSQGLDIHGIATRAAQDHADINGGAAKEHGWTRRPRHGKMADERDASQDRVSALGKAFRGFADRGSDAVVRPYVGLTFDSIGEAYDFYNIYSWEVGFGIRYGRSRTNVKGTKSMQELLCVCSGKPKEQNSTSCRCQCPAMVRLLRTDDQGWYICEYRGNHNYKLLNSCIEKLHFPSHRHIDKYTRDLVGHLRENNVNLSKVYSIIGTFFGRLENVPFTKRCLRTLCGKISKEQADDDVKKTMEMFSEMKAKDSEFTYQVQVDDESRIRTLLWTNGKSKLQYHHFGDVVTFDTTYKTNLYDMPFGMFVGVNNHFQSVLFAGVLMRDEKVERFEWVFSEFVKLMGGKKPVTMLTDQARAMEIAIEKVFPDDTQVVQMARIAEGERVPRHTLLKEIKLQG